MTSLVPATIRITELTRLPKFPIGTQFWSSGKNKRLSTVVDVYTTVDSAGNIMNFRYVASHVFLGQTLFNYDVVEASIARNLVSQEVTK
jgi:hypothetical protein